MSLEPYGPFLNDEDIASILNYDVLEDHDDILQSTPPPQPPPCPICLTPISPEDHCVPGPCDHAFCKPCFRNFLTTTARETKKFPILCPTCAEPTDPQRCLRLVRHLPQVYNPLEALILEKQHMGRISYCANPTCSVAFDFEETASATTSDEKYMVLCPLCNTVTCVRCKSIWHKGQTCAQYNATESQSGILRLAWEKQWRACPNCGNMIERRLGDCYFVLCRCGTGFCHRCGTAYRDLKERAENRHGTPGCNCGLFGANEGGQGGMQAGMAPVPPPLHMYGPAVAPGVRMYGLAPEGSGVEYGQNAKMNEEAAPECCEPRGNQGCVVQ